MWPSESIIMIFLSVRLNREKIQKFQIGRLTVTGRNNQWLACYPDRLFLRPKLIVHNLVNNICEKSPLTYGRNNPLIYLQTSINDLVVANLEIRRSTEQLIHPQLYEDMESKLVLKLQRSEELVKGDKKLKKSQGQDGTL